jgi:ferrous iron transport protein B
MWEVVKVELTIDQRWDLVDRISKETVEVGKYQPSLKDAIASVTVRPLTGIPFAIAVLYGFWTFFGEFAGLFTDGFFVRIFGIHWIPWLGDKLAGAPDWLFTILAGDRAVFAEDFLGDPCFAAGGVLTTGLFMPFGIVLWAVIALFLVLAILEDSGYLPRLAILMDTVLHKIGLHGYAIVPTLVSLGCNVPGVTATRPLETRKQRFIAIALLGVFVPCGAQIGMMEELVPSLVGWVFLTLAIGYLGFGWILNKIVPGESPEILMDVPPYQLPTMSNILRKTWSRTQHFLFVAVPFVLLGCVIVMVMYVTGAMDALASGLEGFLMTVFGVPADATASLVVGFLRKDLAIGLLPVDTMSTYQVFKSVVLLTIYFPCLATFAMLLKELNWKEILGTLGFLAVTALVFGGVLNLIGMAGGW